jgi:hypothetical protein
VDLVSSIPLFDAGSLSSSPNPFVFKSVVILLASPTADGGCDESLGDNVGCDEEVGCEESVGDNVGCDETVGLNDTLGDSLG